MGLVLVEVFRHVAVLCSVCKLAGGSISAGAFGPKDADQVVTWDMVG